MSANNAALRKVAAQIEVAASKYTEGRPKDPSVDEFLRSLEPVEKIHPLPDELFFAMYKESGDFAKAIVQFRQEMFGRRVRDTQLADTVIAWAFAPMLGGHIKPAKPEPVESVEEALTEEQRTARAAVKAADRHADAQRRAGEKIQAKEAVRLVLLDLLSPTGKVWRDLSIAEYMKIGEKQLKHGKRMIASGHKRAELLATATTEAELAKVFGRA